ncbi:hypothetical protein [Nocardia lasii]|uniref:Uncharacterized protein n=1 Tax=Nocardia lasii TaxID=1616107 RepID=A0ABW1JWV8_9NOCA
MTTLSPRAKTAALLGGLAVLTATTAGAASADPVTGSEQRATVVCVAPDLPPSATAGPHVDHLVPTPPGGHSQTVIIDGPVPATPLEHAVPVPAQAVIVEGPGSAECTAFRGDGVRVTVPAPEGADVVPARPYDPAA